MEQVKATAVGHTQDTIGDANQSLGIFRSCVLSFRRVRGGSYMYKLCWAVAVVTATLVAGFAGVAHGQHKKLPYDTLRDFQPITKIADIPLTCAAPPSLGVSSLKDLVALAKAKPAEIFYGSAGNGSMLHLATELLARRTGIVLTHVPFKGGSLAVTALLGNQVNLLCMTTSSLKPYVQHRDRTSTRLNLTYDDAGHF